MNTVNSLITLILLLVAVFSVATSNPLLVLASTSNESDNDNGDDGAAAPPDDSGGAPPAPNSDENGFNTNGDGDGFDEGDVPPATNDEDYTVTCWNGEEVSELSDCPKEEQEIPNCDFDEFVNEDNECEKLPEEPVTAALPPCDGSLQNCVTENGDVCLAGASTHECELPNPGDLEVSPGVPFPNTQPEQDGDEDNDGILDYYQEEDYEPNPYCDLVSDEYMASGGNCHDRKDYDEETLLYGCNDGTQKEDWRDCKDATKDKDEDEDECPAGMVFFSNGKGTCMKEGYCKAYPNDDQCKSDHNYNDNNKPNIIQKTTVINSASASATAFTTAAEISNCKLDGNADGILQKFDTAKYQACGLYTNGQKAYSDGFIVGCIQVGNTQLICQSFVDSSILNVKIPATQSSTQATSQPTQQGIQPAAIAK